jgi:ABC-2 type transport system permease protein
VRKNRLFYVIKKEFIQIGRDRRLLPLLIIMPLIQLILFGYVFSTDVKNISTAVVDRSLTVESRTLVSSIRSAGYFTITGRPEGRAALADMMENGEIRVGIIIPEDYARNIARGETASVEAVIDGSDPNTGGTAVSYLSRVIAAQGAKLTTQALGGRAPTSPLDTRIRVLYNPDLKSVNYMIPGLVGMLLMLITTLLAAAAIVREREKGTMEHLIVMPVRRWELILGKLLPFVVFGFFDVILVSIVGTLWFKVPFRGDVVLLMVVSLIFIATSLGVGLFVSTTARTQQQAMMTAYFVALPTMILSGLMFPIESMPKVVQLLTYLVPLRYFLIIVRSIFLKGSGFFDLWQNILLLSAYGAIVFALSVWRFQKKLT